MLQKNKEKVIILISVIIIILNIITLPKRNFSYNSEVKTSIAKGIVVLEQDEQIEKNVDRNSFPIEYNFVIKNFDDNDNVNEVDFDYKIKIEQSVLNFPIKYKLIDCDNNSEIQLNNGETPILTLGKFKKETRKFKLYVEWNDVCSQYEEKIEIKLRVEAVQCKEEKNSEKKTGI